MLLQLTDLPLSFCQLPHLKWLDLKGNPLNPTLKKVVGDCLNQKECESAARKVIGHLKRLQAQVEMEREEKMRQERGKAICVSFCFNHYPFMQHWSEGKESIIQSLWLMSYLDLPTFFIQHVSLYPKLRHSLVVWRYINSKNSNSLHSPLEILD